MVGQIVVQPCVAHYILAGKFSFFCSEDRVAVDTITDFMQGRSAAVLEYIRSRNAPETDTFI